VPVLLVHPDRGEQLAEAHGVPGILVALDLSPHSEAVLEPVITMARLLQSHVTLLHVVEPFYASSPSVPYQMLQDPTITEVRRADAQKHLDRIADGLRRWGLSVSTRVEIGGSAGATVLETLRDRKYGMVAMTTHGAGGMRRLFLGSVADRVIRAAAKPVLVLRPQGLPG
jgi:nucleotide-binding universal stress UspA family protein